MTTLVKKLVLRSWIIWLLGSLFFLIDYFLRTSPSIMVHTLERAFHVNAFQLGLLSSMFFIAYVAMQIPVGALIDKFGPRKLFIAAVLICAIGCVIFGTTHSFAMLYVGRFCIGFGGAFSFIGTLTLIRHWFPDKHFAILAGATQGLGMLGAYIGGAPLAAVFHTLGWRETLIYTAIAFVILLILIVLFVKDFPDEHAEHYAHKRMKKMSIWQDLLTILKNKQAWLNGVYIGMLYGPTIVFAVQWGTSYTAQAYHRSTIMAAAEVGIVFIGLTVGCPIIGWLSDATRNRLLWMRICALMCLISISLLIYGTKLPQCAWCGSSTGIMTLAFIYGMFNSGIIPSYALGSEIAPPEYTGMALGFANFASLIIGAILVPIVGYILDILWTGQIHHGHPHYLTTHYQLAFITLPCCFIIALIMTFLIKETHGQNQIQPIEGEK